MANPKVTIYGIRWCPDCRRTRKFLGEHGVRYRWIDLVEQPAAAGEFEKLGDGRPVLPTVLIEGGATLFRPSNAELAGALEIEIGSERRYWPLIIVGGGPAGLTAAIFATQDGIDTLVIEREFVGGNANVSGQVENMPGFPDPISGFELSDRLREQARRANVEMIQAAEVVEVDSLGRYHTVVTADGTEYSCFALIIATGSTYRRMRVPGESDFINGGVHYCAASDAFAYTGEKVAVVGGGNSAAEAALALSEHAAKVNLLVRGDSLTANSILVQRLLEVPNVEVQYHLDVREFCGADQFESVLVRDEITGSEREIEARGAFVFIGMVPNSGFLKGSAVALDDWGFVCTGPDAPPPDAEAAELMALLEDSPAALPGLFETSVPGVFAAGDIRKNSSKYVATAAGEGAAVAMSAGQYLRGMS